MLSTARIIALQALLLFGTNIASAAESDDALLNRGHDPFFQISSQVPHCPEPLGPRLTKAAWLKESHDRVERGNSCWLAGRCRLYNAYLYDNEIADSTRRRLSALAVTMPSWKQSTLWILIQRRWISVQGCVAPGFDIRAFIAALRDVPDTERVIDETTAHPEHGTPYPVLPVSQ